MIQGLGEQVELLQGVSSPLHLSTIEQTLEDGKEVSLLCLSEDAEDQEIGENQLYSHNKYLG